MKIAELPFRERPVRELLNLDGDRDKPDLDYSGYGWARVDGLLLAQPGAATIVRDHALVLGLHSSDDGERLRDDIELEFELPDARPVSVLASMFLHHWLPRLPRDATSIVLALCNPHHAVLQPILVAQAPIQYAFGDVDSWLDHGRICLAASDSWATLVMS